LQASQFRIHSGNQQTGQVDQTLPQPLVVKLTDTLGRAPLPASVKFTVVAGGGQVIGPSTVTSDSNGLAQVRWQLGLVPQINLLQAKAVDFDLPAVTFLATGVDSSTAVDEHADRLPKQFALWQNSPNPFNPETTIRFDLANASEVSLTIFDLNGRLVKLLTQSYLSAGTHISLWNGRDEQGKAIDSGVYFYLLRARNVHSGEEVTASRKLILMK
jgi:hypothetical protein